MARHNGAQRADETPVALISDENRGVPGSARPSQAQ